VISDYFLQMETKSSEMMVISEKVIEFREFDIDEGLIKGTILFIDGSMLELMEYLKGDLRLKYRFHYMNKTGQMIFRYDNAPHHKVSTFPDHKHIAEGVVASSPQKLSDVLNEIEILISGRSWDPSRPPSKLKR
jgi:hypothetical protein